LSAEDVDALRTVCLSLGVRAVVRREEGAVKASVEFNLGAATGKPWFTDDDEDYATVSDSC
jgi:hypothetical protein